MPGIASIDSYLNAYTVNVKAQQLMMNKIAAQATVAGIGASLWAATGIPIAGSNTAKGRANGRVLTSATAGAMPYINPSAPATMHLLSSFALAINAGGGCLYLIDRISDCNLDHSEATGAVTNVTATSRLASTAGVGDGAQIWCEVTTGFSAASNTITFGYTNQVGTSSRTTSSIVTTASAVAGRSVNSGFFVPLQNGDTGVRSIETVTLVAGTATGAYNVCLVKPLWSIPNCGGTIPFGIGLDNLLALPSAQQIMDNSCLTFLYLPATAETYNLTAHTTLIEN